MRHGLVVGSGLIALGVAQAAMSGAAPRVVAAASTEPVTVYRTQKGDTLGVLAARYMTSPRDAPAVMRLSGITNPDRIRVGTALRIPDRLLKSTPVFLTAIAVTGPVARAPNGGSPSPLAKGDVVKEGDRVSTGADAFVTLGKPDGSRITLPSHTVLRVAVLRHVVLGDSDGGDLVIESGRGEMAITPLRQPADRLEIRTPGSVAAVRGTEFRVAYDADRSVSTLEVLDGRVAESATENSASADVVTGQAAQRPLGGERRITPLPPAPELTPPDATEPFPEVVMRVVDPHPGWSYHFVLAHDPAFTDIFAEVTAPDGVARFDNIPLAPTSARITAIDENGVEGFAKTYLVERPPPPSPSSGG